MKKRFNMIFGAVFMCMAIISQVLAVTYAPNKNDNIIKDNVSTLDKIYTQDDVDRVLEIYNGNNDLTQQELEVYDLDNSVVINSIDASIMLDYIK